MYYAQVEFLRRYDENLFDDDIEAWQYGPVEPEVYRAYKGFGSGRIPRHGSAPPMPTRAEAVVRRVAETYGKMSAFDLVTLSHREGGAWAMAYSPERNRVISNEAIKASDDMTDSSGYRRTLKNGIDEAFASIPNALRLLENS